MAKKDYSEISKKILELVGGKDNVSYLGHCVTRVRFNVKDKTLVKVEEINKISGVFGSQWMGEQFQIIVGNEVDAVYEAVRMTGGFAQEEKIDEKLDEKLESKPKFSIKGVFMNFFDIMAASIVPILPVFYGMGFIKILLLILDLTGILTAESQTYITLNMFCSTILYFLPIFVAVSASKRLKTNLPMSMLVGAMLLSPTFVANVSAQVPMSVFGLPIYAGSYSSSIFPTIISLIALSYIEKLVAIVCKKIPNAIKGLIQLGLTSLIIIPTVYCLTAPIGAVIGNYLVAAIMWLYETTGFIGVGIFSALFPMLVITGMHHGLGVYLAQSFSTVGYDPICCVGSYIANICLGAACLGVAIKSKKTEEKPQIVTVGFTAAVLGVSEPALFGVAAKEKIVLFSTMAGCGVAGLIAGLLHVACYAFPSVGGLMGTILFANPENPNTVFNYIIAIAIGSIVAFACIMLFYKDKKEELN